MGIIFFIKFYLIILSWLSSFNAESLGFSTDLIHIDSPKSPFYNPLLTPLERSRNALRRSENRLKYLISMSKNFHSISDDIISSPGEYLMKITLGTPPFDIFLIIDTGSDLTWTQCAPCTHCFKQKAPLFEPKKSSTYKTYPYDSSTCKSLDIRHRSPNGTCEYEIKYADLSYTHGDLASENLTLGPDTSRPVSYHGFTFGCGFNNKLRFFKDDQAGVIGLGGGPLSLTSQIKPTINGKFSYCLPQDDPKFNISGEINFGDSAVVSGDEVVTTPILPKSRQTNYYLDLRAISVNNQRIELLNLSQTGYADALIDSGALVVSIASYSYEKLVKLVKEAVKIQPIPDPLEGFKLCYKLGDKLSYPKIKVHFRGGTLHLKPVNTFYRVGNDARCLAFNTNFPLDDLTSYGSVAQINFLVGYDTVKKTVSFKPTKCGH